MINRLSSFGANIVWQLYKIIKCNCMHCSRLKSYINSVQLGWKPSRPKQVNPRHVHFHRTGRMVAQRNEGLSGRLLAIHYHAPERSSAMKRPLSDSRSCWAQILSWCASSSYPVCPNIAIHRCSFGSWRKGSERPEVKYNRRTGFFFPPLRCFPAKPGHVHLRQYGGREGSAPILY